MHIDCRVAWEPMTVCEPMEAAEMEACGWTRTWSAMRRGRYVPGAPELEEMVMVEGELEGRKGGVRVQCGERMT